MSKPLFLRRSAVMLVIWSSAVATAFASAATAVEVLPPSIVIFAEIPQPQNLLSAIYDHHLVGRAWNRSIRFERPWRKSSTSTSRRVVAIVESQMGLPWRRIVGQATGGGVSVAVDAKTQGVAILARATDKTIACQAARNTGEPGKPRCQAQRQARSG